MQRDALKYRQSGFIQGEPVSPRFLSCALLFTECSQLTAFQCACWWMYVLIYTYTGSKVMAAWYVQPAENILKGRKHGYRCVDGDREHGML